MDFELIYVVKSYAPMFFALVRLYRAIVGYLNKCFLKEIGV